MFLSSCIALELLPNTNDLISGFFCSLVLIFLSFVFSLGADSEFSAEVKDRETRLTSG